MFHIRTFVIVAVLATSLMGCTSSGVRKAPVPVGPSAEERATAEADAALEEALAAFARGEKRTAASQLEALSNGYVSQDGRFERAVLTALALTYLELGYRADTQRTIGRLEQTLGAQELMMPETQMLLHLGQAMRGGAVQALGEPGEDPRLTQAMAGLLN